MSQDTASARTSCMAIRVGLRLRASTRGLAPFWSCFARCAATVMNRNLLSTSRGTIRCDMASTLLVLGKSAQDPLGQAKGPHRPAAGGTDDGLELLDAVLEVLVHYRVF